jgi:hypothetical protein
MDDAGHASTDRRSNHLLDATRKNTMNTTKLSLLAYPVAAILSMAAASTAFADDITPDNTAAALSTKTRAQVQAELYAARADGSIKAWSTSYNPLAIAKSEKSRADVIAEVKAERTADYAVTWYGEDSGSFALARVKPAVQAQPVFAGTAAPKAQ